MLGVERVRRIAQSAVLSKTRSKLKRNICLMKTNIKKLKNSQNFYIKAYNKKLLFILIAVKRICLKKKFLNHLKAFTPL
jgi:hypothetical protein